MVSKSSQRAGVKRSWPRNKKPVSKIFGLDIRTMAPLEIGGREGFRTGFQVFTKFYFNNVFVSVGVCAYECSFHRGQKRMLGPLELELQVFVRHPMWVLGTKLCKSNRCS